MNGNPYVPPLETGTKSALPHQYQPQLPRGEVARKFAVTGFLGGGLLGTFGYLALIVLIEALLTPPFKSPPNYGQFLIVVVGVGFYMSIFGLCLGLVPYVGWIGYLPFHLFGILLVWAMDRQFFAEVDWTEAPIAAMIMLLTSPIFIAIAFDLRARRIQIPTIPHQIAGELRDAPKPPSGAF